MENSIMQAVVQSFGICASIYLMLFGFLAAILLGRVFFHGNKLLTMIVTILLFLTNTVIIILLGALYIFTDCFGRYARPHRKISEANSGSHIFSKSACAELISSSVGKTSGRVSFISSALYFPAA